MERKMASDNTTPKCDREDNDGNNKLQLQLQKQTTCHKIFSAE
jgi:hypothetical protein